MFVVGHISGLPIEELLAPLLCGGGAMWLAARAWTSMFAGRSGRRR